MTTICNPNGRPARDSAATAIESKRQRICDLTVTNLNVLGTLTADLPKGAAYYGGFYTTGSVVAGVTSGYVGLTGTAPDVLASFEHNTNITADYLVVPADGNYNLQVSSVLTVANAATITAAVFVNGTRLDRFTAAQYFDATAHAEGISLSGNLALVADDQVSLRYLTTVDGNLTSNLVSVTLTSLAA